MKPLSSFSLSVSAGLLSALLVTSVAPLLADDRDLVRSNGSDPYIFVLLDTSGSMTSQVNGSGTVWGADDPNSKAYQAKAAIYDVVKGLNDGVRIGFSTFSQENGRVTGKKWMYKVGLEQADLEGLPWWSDLPFPQEGQGISAGNGSADSGSCGSTNSLSTLYTHEKFGPDGDVTNVLTVDHSGRDWKVTFEAPNTPIGPSLDINVKVQECGSAVVEEATIPLVPFYTEDLDGTPILTADYVANGQYRADGTCSNGWRPNDEGGETSLPTYADPAGRVTQGTDIFARGNVIPWDWMSHEAPGFELSNRDEFLRRMAPNIVVNGQIDPAAIPDFRLGPYYDNSTFDPKSEYSATPPFGFWTATPLAKSLLAVKGWYEAWEPYGKTESTEEAFKCRPKYVLLLTDGKDTCGGNPPAAAAQLLEAGVRTFVIGYGTGVSGNSLQGIADEGGTGKKHTLGSDKMDCELFNYEAPDPANPGQTITKDICDVIAKDTETLKGSLNAIFSSLSTAQTSFAGASVPSGQVEAEDVLLLPSFLAISDRTEWKGSLAMFKRPLPLVAADDDSGLIPDRSKVCVDDPTASEPPTACMAWDAADAMLGQAATIDDIIGGNYKIGPDATQRRVFWARGQAGLATPRQLNYLEPTQAADPTDSVLAQYELWDLLGVEHEPADLSDDEDANLEAEGILASILAQRVGKDAEDGSHTYILGDIFHSKPINVGAPSRYEYMAANLYGDGECWDGNDFDYDNKGYRCFWLRNKWRRQVAYVGSNDGQLHAFDAGRVRKTDSGGDFNPRFTVGTGKELFAFVPTEMMGQYKTRIADSPSHQWGVDGEIAYDDFFIAPTWDGSSTIDADDREWRSLLIGGLRRGGRGYYALDVTTPDPIAEEAGQGEVMPPTEAVQGYVPGCLDNSPTGCGPLPYPALRWEYLDLDPTGAPVDSDANGGDDLGPSWSLPVTGRIRVDDGSSDPVDRFVAIFGGGLDPADDAVGNFIYMVDVETGKTLYKRATKAAVPSQPAAVDSDRNGYLDLVYVGDVDGHLYKINMAETPTLVPDAVTSDLVVSEDDWKPLEIFDTEGRAIFFSPTVIWSARRRSYAIALGTGDREDLWSVTEGEPDAMFVFMDRGFSEDNLTQPYTQDSLMTFKRDDPETPLNDVLLQSPPLTDLPGYSIEFAAGERLISNAFAISGLMVFSTFEPTSAAIGGVCSSNGISNLYTLQTSTGNPLVSGRDRYRTVEGFVSDPFASPSVESSGDGDSGATDDTPPEDLKAVTDLLKSQMPDDCKFTNKRIDVKAIRSDTGVEWLAPIPVCVQQKNWKQWQTR